MNKLLVTTDLSDLSRTGISHAKQLLKQYPKMEVIVLFVIEKHLPNPLYAHYEKPIPTRDEAMQQLIEFLGEDAVLFTPKITIAENIHEGIIAVAKKLKVDFIRIASHGYGSLKSFFIGSTTQKLIEKCPIPIITNSVATI